jgi:hypothetical protein
MSVDSVPYARKDSGRSHPLAGTVRADVFAGRKYLDAHKAAAVVGVNVGPIWHLNFKRLSMPDCSESLVLPSAGTVVSY